MSPFQREQGLSKYIEQIEARDPALAQQLRDQMDMDTSLANQKLFGLDKHELAKKGIEGFAGRKSHLSAEKNADEAYKATIDYMKNAVQAHTYKKTKNEFTKNVLNDHDLAFNFFNGA